MQTSDRVKNILIDTLQIGNLEKEISLQTHLLGEIAELDSMAVVNVVTALEEEFDITFEDDEITAENFETLRTLVDFVQSKLVLAVGQEM